MLEIQVLAWDRHKNVAGSNMLIHVSRITFIRYAQNGKIGKLNILK
jgi:hypothetical protein